MARTVTTQAEVGAILAHHIIDFIAKADIYAEPQLERAIEILDSARIDCEVSEKPLVEEALKFLDACLHRYDRHDASCNGMSPCEKVATVNAKTAAEEVVNVMLSVPKYVVDREATLAELSSKIQDIIAKHHTK